jgi:hypothetical protein
MNIPAHRLKLASDRLLLSLMVLSGTIAFIYLGSIFLTGQPVPAFDMNGFRTIPSWLQAIQLFLIGAISLIFGFIHPGRSHRPSRAFLFILAFLAIYVSMDEIFKIHLQHPALLMQLDSQSLLRVYTVIYLMFPLLFYRDLIALWQVHRRSTFCGLLGMGIVAIGGIGGELLKDILPSLLSSVWLEKIRVAIEEGSELIGESLILYGALLFAIRTIESQQNMSLKNRANGGQMAPDKN